MDIKTAVEEYDRLVERGAYEEVQKETVRLLTRLLEGAAIKPHSIPARIKSRNSLLEKIERDGKSYNSLEDIKDIVGVRIITYFEDELEQIDALLKTEFDISKEHSYDRRTKLGDDQFGYRSIHYVCRFKENRLSLGEYSFLRGYTVEIQTRSILQHAWAEIEHDYYKTKGPKPEKVRRRNSRLAGLLELADDEFIAIRKEMEIYRKNIDLRIDADENLENVELDTVSVTSFIRQESLVTEYDAFIAEGASVPLKDEPLAGSVSVALTALRSRSITTLGQLRQSMRDMSDGFRKFTSGWQKLMTEKGLPKSPAYTRGVSLYQFAIYLAALEGTEALEKTFTVLMKKEIKSDPIIMELVAKLPDIAK